MEKILITVDERDYPKNKPDEPFFQLRESRYSFGSRVIARGNLSGMRRFSGRFSEFGVNSIQVMISELAPVVDLLPDPTQIIEASLGTNFVDPGETRDIAALSQMPNLRILDISPNPPAQPIANHAPQIQFLTIGGTNRKTMAGLANLEGLRITGSPKDLDTVKRSTLKTLFLQAFDQKQADLLLPCENLQTLSVLTRRSGLSWAFLRNLPKLDNFAFEGPAQQEWASLPETLRKISISKVDDRTAMAQALKAAEVVSIGFNPKARHDDGYYKGDLLEAGDPFRTIEGPIFMKDIM